MRFKVTLEFEGTRFSGWQAQKNMKTVQGELFKACENVFQTNDFEFYGSGRTDAGVHAIEQVAHLEVRTQLPLLQIRYKLNDNLPYDINILNVEKADANFHARHDAIARSYIYLISKRKTAFGKPFVWWIKDKLDFNAMQEASQFFIGMKDFKAFSDDSPDEKSTLVELKSCDLYEYGDTIIIHIVGSHFLWKMVRRMTGVLAEIGRGNMKPSDIERLFKQHKSNVAKYTAPPSGLFLEHVYYPGEEVLTGENSFKLPFSVI